jgi:hypothetical protein
VDYVQWFKFIDKEGGFWAFLGQQMDARFEMMSETKVN